MSVRYTREVDSDGMNPTDSLPSEEMLSGHHQAKTVHRNVPRYICNCGNGTRRSDVFGQCGGDDPVSLKMLPRCYIPFASVIFKTPFLRFVLLMAVSQPWHSRQSTLPTMPAS